MDWTAYPAQLANFAEQLRSVPGTEETCNALQTQMGAFVNSWRATRTLRAKDIPLPAPRDKALFPERCKTHEAFLSFVFLLGASFDEEAVPQQCDFQVVVRGAAAYEHATIELEDHWRVDTDLFAENPSPIEPHPLIHFQRGGHSQDAFVGKPGFIPGSEVPQHAEGQNWLSLLQSPGPRVPSVPFCPLLAIDYVIGQHNGAVHRQLRAAPEYAKIVRVSQERLWNPFFSRLGQDAAFRRRWLGTMMVPRSSDEDAE